MKLLAGVRKYWGRTWRTLLKGHRLPVSIGFLLTFGTWWLYTSSPLQIQALLTRLDNLVYDLRFNALPPRRFSGEHSIVIVDYDQRSLQAEGQWPWSRFKLGDLVAALTEHGALVIGFDVTFPEYERNLINELRLRVDDANALEALLPGLDGMEALLDGDRHFAASMERGDVVLGFSFRPGENLAVGLLPQPIIDLDTSLAPTLLLQNMQGYESNVDVLQSSAAGAGFFDTMPDPDGVIRASPLVMRFQDQLYPSLALEMARLYFFEDNFSIDTDSIGGVTTITGINMGSIRIPTDAFGRVLVPYQGPSRLGTAGTFPYISATDVLRGNLSADQREQLVNSLVLIGTTATGLFDLRSTPMEPVYPGVEVHANILHGLLNAASLMTIGPGPEASGAANMLAHAQANPFPSRPDWEAGAVISAIIGIGATLSLVYPHLGATLLITSSLTFMLGLIGLNFKLWSTYGLDISLVILLFLILIITIFNMTFGFLRESLSRRAIKGMFDQYVPPAHIDAMLADPDNYNFQGESREMSVLFSDIRSFTSISERLSAIQLKQLLNDFFTPITEIIFRHNGTIDKYVGDMVMAFWGAPLPDIRHPQHAVEAALDMLARVQALRQEFSARGMPEIAIGIGINTGLMNVGDMGSSYRRAYTVLGDAVNLASRLESLTKFYGVSLLIGEKTREQLQGILCRQADKVQVKGKAEPICIYEPICREQDASPELLTLVEAHHEALGLYHAREWEAAEAAFMNLQTQDPGTALYHIYLDRIAQLRESGVPENWDGTFKHTEK